MTKNMIGDLRDWSELNDSRKWETLLIGNGLSTNIWSMFEYASLFDVADLSPESRSIFSGLSTTNFEAVLQSLAQTRLVHAAAKRSGLWVAHLYDHVRDALFGAVHRVHLPWALLPDVTCDTVALTLNSHTRVFTLNYDLILYWARMSSNSQVKVADFLWSPDTEHCRPNTFDATSIELHGGYTGLYNLHGGLHLWQDSSSGRTGKWINDGTPLLQDLPTRYLDGQRQPLLVSEGTAQDKLRTIRRSDYLSFVYQTLVADTAPTVVFGTSLSEHDKHIVEALAHGTPKHVAISVRPPIDESQRWLVKEFTARMGRLLRPSGHSLEFFDSTTHPLGDPALRIN